MSQIVTHGLFNINLYYLLPLLHSTLTQNYNVVGRFNTIYSVFGMGAYF